MPCGDFGILRVCIIHVQDSNCSLYLYLCMCILTKLKIIGSLHVAFRRAFCTMVLHIYNYTSSNSLFGSKLIYLVRFFGQYGKTLYTLNCCYIFAVKCYSMHKSSYICRYNKLYIIIISLQEQNG